jgi:hypothetical protein
MLGFFSSASSSCLFHKTGEYLCSASSLQLKYVSAQFGRLKKSKSRYMFARLFLPLKFLFTWNVLLVSGASKVQKLHCSITWSAASALFCLAAPKQSLQDSLFCFFVSTAQIFEYVGYLQCYAAPKPRCHQRMSFCSAVSKRSKTTVCSVRCLVRSKISISKSTYLLPFAASNIQRSLLQSCFKMSPLLSNESLSSVISEHSK